MALTTSNRSAARTAMLGNVLALAALLGIALLLVRDTTRAASTERASKPHSSAQPPSPELAALRTQLTNHLQEGRFEQAVTLCHQAIDSDAHDSEAKAHLLLVAAQAQAELARWREVVAELQRAIEEDADLLEPAAPSYAGRRIGAQLTDAIVALKSALKGPEADASRKALKDAYYLRRVLAGGCD